jgi:hypothetical protein
VGMRSPSPTQRRRAAKLSQWELTQSAPFASIDPASIPEMKVWLRVDQASDSGTLSIPDAMGGSPATQATGANKPTLGTTGNGLAKLTNAVGTGLLLPLSAGVQNTAYFGMGFWMRASTLTGGDMFSVNTGASMASANRIQFRQSTNDLKTFVWIAAGESGIRSGGTSRGIVLLNVWKFFMYEFNGAGATEADRSTFKDMGTTFAAPQAQTFTQEVATNTTMPTVLVTATGNAVLFNRTTTYANGYIGEIGPDIFFYDPRTMTDTKRVQLAQYRVPLA